VTCNPADTLAILLGLPQQAIDFDLQNARDENQSIAREISILEKTPRSARTAEANARIAHLKMIQAYMVCDSEDVLPEFKTFYAALGASGIIENVETVAANKDSLADLAGQMDAIRQREGLTADESWGAAKNGPVDYRGLSDAYGRVLERIGDTAFIFVLRRYRLAEQADLFEADRVTFEILREVGRRLTSANLGESETVEELTNRFIEKKHGANAVHRIETRVAQLRAKYGA
jgi:hypothetical protein